LEALSGESLLNAPLAGHAWTIRRFTERASLFHARDVPIDVTREVWVNDVTMPALVLGSAQRDEIVDHGALRRAGVELCKRRSGGGAVLLIPAQVAWLDVLVPASDPLWCSDVGRSFEWLGEVWRSVLGESAVVHRGALVRNEWSAAVCFAGLGPGELTVDGRKTVGISQRRTRTSARFQCAVYTAFDPGAIGALLTLDDVERAALAANLAATVTAAEAPVDLIVEQFVAALSTV
jgi:lipoate---protein ligase